MPQQRHIAVEVLILFLFYMFRLFVTFFQRIKWLLDGTKRSVSQRKIKGGHKDSAQLLDIRLKKNLDPMCILNSARHFIATHSSFVNPTYVLKKEVSLYYVDHNEAVFVEAPPGVEVWRSKYAAWHRLAQYKYAVKLIKMPLHCFYRLVENFEDPGDQLILLEFIPRTGSTLLCQLFEETGRIVTYAEPEVLVHPLDHIRNAEQMSREDTETYLNSLVRYMCRPQLLPPGQAIAYMAKIPACFFMKVKRMYTQCFPKARYLFQYRNGASTINSLERTFPNLPMLKAYYFFFFWFTWLWRKNVILGCTVYMQNRGDQELIALLSRTKQPEKLRFSVYYSSMLSSFLKQQETIHTVPAIKYEDIVHNPLESVRAIFDHCSLPRDLIPKAMNAFTKDSQANSILSWERMQNGPTPVDKDHVHPEVHEDLQAVFRHFNVPDPHVDVRLPYTITSSAK